MCNIQQCYVYHVVPYIPSTYNWKFIPFDCLHLIPSPPNPLPLVTINLMSLSTSLFVFEV